MVCKLEDVSKVYQNSRIFHGVNLTLESGFYGVVLGGNGSGKSTLLKIVSGGLMPTTGKVSFALPSKNLTGFEMVRHLSFAAPYIDLIEDLTMRELLHFSQKFKPFKRGISTDEVAAYSGLMRFLDKPVKYFSSGMKQRLKLTIAILSDTAMLLLDEPHSNLDQKGMQWYQDLLGNHLQNRIVLVGSNHQEGEYFFANECIDIADYKR
ncbi:MAG: ATP-binding cassette domain-containing protein [Schleiferiaceae bacterium]|nr:ATP-binding cassette domain-containing protein [Schleiferiaceae bacterium]